MATAGSFIVPDSDTSSPAAADPAPTQIAEVERQEMSYMEALNLASQLHRAGQYAAAERLYRALIELNPQDPTPVHYLGVLFHLTGHTEEGLSLIHRSIEMDPKVASWHNNLGNVMLDTDQIEAASRAYDACRALDPGNVEVLNNLGVMYRSLGRREEALELLKRAVELKPGFTDAHHNLSSVYFDLKRYDEGFTHSAEALSQEPAHTASRRVLALIYARLGRMEEAADIYREWLRLAPDSLQAKHYLAGCTGENVPDRADQQYVEKVFDNFAASFDAKLASLDYKAPELVGQTVERVLGAPKGDLQVLDAGCGTGLCGPGLARYAQHLVGVDLSQAMLQRAAERGAYHELVKEDLVVFLQAHVERFDLLVSADTLCYFGALEEVLAAAAASLRPGGLMVFTVEAHDDAQKTFWLHAHGRYSHDRRYLEDTLHTAGFGSADFESVVLRLECGEPVTGWLVTVNRPAP